MLASFVNLLSNGPWYTYEINGFDTNKAHELIIVNAKGTKGYYVPHLMVDQIVAVPSWFYTICRHYLLDHLQLRLITKNMMKSRVIKDAHGIFDVSFWPEDIMLRFALLD